MTSSTPVGGRLVGRPPPSIGPRGRRAAGWRPTRRPARRPRRPAPPPATAPAGSADHPPPRSRTSARGTGSPAAGPAPATDRAGGPGRGATPRRRGATAAGDRGTSPAIPRPPGRRIDEVHVVEDEHPVRRGALVEVVQEDRRRPAPLNRGRAAPSGPACRTRAASGSRPAITPRHSWAASRSPSSSDSHPVRRVDSLAHPATREVLPAPAGADDQRQRGGDRLVDQVEEPRAPHVVRDGRRRAELRSHERRRREAGQLARRVARHTDTVRLPLGEHHPPG